MEVEDEVFSTGTIILSLDLSYQNYTPMNLIYEKVA